MDFEQMRAHRRENRLQAVVLIFGMAAVMSVVGYALGGRQGIWFALVFSGVSGLLGPVMSPKMVLRMYRARLIDPRQAPELYDLCGRLVARAELAHPPSLYYVPTRIPNAFAVGVGRGAAVAVSDGLLRLMNPRELAGVLAHELSHIRFHDTRLMALGDVFSRITAMMSQIGQLLLLLALPAMLFGAAFIPFWVLLVLIFAPTASTLLQLALSRSREFNADLGAVELTGDPAGLAAALQKLERAETGAWWQRILMPYRVREPAVLRTHPLTEERVARLMALSSVATVDVSPLDPDALADVDHVAATRFPPVTGGPRWHVSGLWY